MAAWIISVIEQHGYAAVALLMLLENVFPPIPSELVMPFAGFVAARGELHPALVVVAGTAGSLAGTLPWYWLGRAIGFERLRHLADRHGRWLTLHADDLQRARDWFDRHGGRAVLFGRLVPALRSVISVPAGVARMGLPRFLAWSAAGSLAWTALLAGLGWWLGDDQGEVAQWVEPVTRVVLGLAVATYLWRVWTFKPS